MYKGYIKGIMCDGLVTYGAAQRGPWSHLQNAEERRRRHVTYIVMSRLTDLINDFNYIGVGCLTSLSDLSL